MNDWKGSIRYIGMRLLSGLTILFWLAILADERPPLVVKLVAVALIVWEGRDLFAGPERRK